jgi:hypothetical protein
MTTDFEELVTETLSQHAARVTVRPDLSRLVAQARRRHLRTRLVTCSALGAATAASVVVAVCMAATVTPPIQVRTAAYVVSRSDQALTSVAPRSFVAVATTFGGNGLPASIFPIATSTRVLRTEYWSFGDRSRVEAFADNGKAVIGVGTQSGAVTTVTGAVYLSGTWWRALLPPGDPITVFRAARAPQCNVHAVLAAVLALANVYAELSPGWPEALRDVLACERAVATSRQVIDGERVIRIEPKVPGVDSAGVRIVSWVSASTYLPVRVLVTVQGTGPRSRWWQQEDYIWRRPSPANLYKLTQVVPAGFRRVAAPSFAIG